MRDIELEAICYRASLRVFPYGMWNGAIPYQVWVALTVDERSRVGPLSESRARKVLQHPEQLERYLTGPRNGSSHGP